jgi:uncharacterized protein (DUF1697 family)
LLVIMPRYVAFLRGVSPMNAKMPELKRAFESVGFSNVKTVLSSGNVVFDSRSKPDASIARQAEKAMSQELDRTFLTIVRPVSALTELIDEDPFAAFGLSESHKRIVIFLREPLSKKLTLPIEADGASILAVREREALAAYIPREADPAFMRVIEKAFGKDITTRTLDTVRKCAAA